MNIKFYYCLISITFCVTKHVEVAADFKIERESHKASKLTTEQLLKVAAMTTSKKFLPMLEPILIPRVVGSEGHETVKKYLVDHMENLGWQVELDSFTDSTPIGQLQFTNVIATLDPSAPRFLVLACHYDSMVWHSGAFVGATDSAVPCAMLLHLASALATPLSKLKNKVSLQLIFFDGEEAFKTWGPSDSLYGSRHLASKLASKSYPAGNTDGTTELNRMDLLVLLDILGAANPKLLDYYRFKTTKWYNQLANAEMRLANSNQLAKYSSNKKYFQNRSNFFGIEDDHVPFMQKGVPIVHFISFPFPHEWHSEGDNLQLLDMDTINNLNKITQVFVAEYLRLDV